VAGEGGFGGRVMVCVVGGELGLGVGAFYWVQLADLIAGCPLAFTFSMI